MCLYGHPLHSSPACSCAQKYTYYSCAALFQKMSALNKCPYYVQIMLNKLARVHNSTYYGRLKLNVAMIDSQFSSVL